MHPRTWWGKGGAAFLPGSRRGWGFGGEAPQGFPARLVEGTKLVRGRLVVKGVWMGKSAGQVAFRPLQGSMRMALHSATIGLMARARRKGGSSSGVPGRAVGGRAGGSGSGVRVRVGVPGESGSRSPGVPSGQGPLDDLVAAQLRSAAELKRAAEDGFEEAVRSAREEGWSWVRIGQAVGAEPSTLFRRFRVR